MPEIQMPKLSDTMTEGTLVAWKKKKGDKVTTGEVIAEIETDKATMEWESPEDGTLTEIYVQEGGKVEVGEKIAFIGAEGETAEEKKKEPQPKEKEEKAPAKKKEQAETEKPAPAEKKEPETAPPQEDKKPAEKKPAAPPKSSPEPKSESAGEARVKASPIARRLAAEQGLDLSTIKGTGPDGRVTESDVRAAKFKGGVSPSKPAAAQHIPAGEGSRISLSGMRKLIAERLVASKGPVPHFYLNIEVDAGPLMSARAELKSAGEKSDSSKITVNDFVLKAAIEAAVKVPKANASFDGDAIVQYNDVNLGIAVALEEASLRRSFAQPRASRFAKSAKQ